MKVKKLGFGLSTLAALSVIPISVITMPSHPAMAVCVAKLSDGDFESQRSRAVRSPWFLEGRGGIDIGRSLSYSGKNNAWVRHNSGWNAIRQPVRLLAGTVYTLTARVRTSGNVRDGYFGFRDARQRPVAEIKFGPLPTYQELRVQFRPTQTGTYNIFAGIWALNQDTWAQIDNVDVDYFCNDNIGIPSN